MTMMDENELRRRFAELRDADREGAPDFVHTYDRACMDPIWRLQGNLGRKSRSSRRPRLRVRRLVIGAAAAVVLAVLMNRARSLSPEVTPEVASWRAPTDVLLDTPGSELLGTMPALGESILDKMIPTYSLRGS